MVMANIKPWLPLLPNLVSNIYHHLLIHPSLLVSPNENTVIFLIPALPFFTKLQSLFATVPLLSRPLHISLTICLPPLSILTLPFTNYLIIIQTIILFEFLVAYVIPGFAPIVLTSWNLDLGHVCFLVIPPLTIHFIVLILSKLNYLCHAMSLLLKIIFIFKKYLSHTLESIPTLPMTLFPLFLPIP